MILDKRVCVACVGPDAFLRARPAKQGVLSMTTPSSQKARERRAFDNTSVFVYARLGEALRRHETSVMYLLRAVAKTYSTNCLPQAASLSSRNSTGGNLNTTFDSILSRLCRGSTSLALCAHRSSVRCGRRCARQRVRRSSTTT